MVPSQHRRFDAPSARPRSRVWTRWVFPPVCARLVRRRSPKARPHLRPRVSAVRAGAPPPACVPEAGLVPSPPGAAAFASAAVERAGDGREWNPAAVWLAVRLAHRYVSLWSWHAPPLGTAPMLLPADVARARCPRSTSAGSIRSPSRRRGGELISTACRLATPDCARDPATRWVRDKAAPLRRATWPRPTGRRCTGCR